MRHSRSTLFVGAGAAAAALTAAVVLWPDGSGGSNGPAGSALTRTGTDGKSPTAASTPTPTPTPARSYALSTAPRTIPAVRAHEAARGPGWRPTASSAVVVAPGSEALADEARLLAGELRIEYRGPAAARPGDVTLALETARQAAPESYTLTTRADRVTVSGPDEAGVFYGTRTLKQAVRVDGALPEGTVRDRPAKPQRGLNLDIARKHFSAEWIEDRLREMADLKLNQLGLHFSDDQGFRIESLSHPEVVSAERLTRAEVRRIVALAARLHIEVVPEIDSPGHLGAVMRAHPRLQLRDRQGAASRGAVDISDPAAARIVDDLLKEYTALFPGAYWHLGADEYRALTVRDPEGAYPQLARAAAKAYGEGAGVADLATGWLNDRAAVVRAAGKKPKAWNDGLFRGGRVAADGDIEVEYWTGKELGQRDPEEYLREGRRMVNLNDEYLYYVLGEPNTFQYPTGRRIYNDWTPLLVRGSTTPVPEKYAAQILGGRLAVWCDYANAQTPAQVARGIRMPLRAVAQKLWTPGRPALSWERFAALGERL
ncbi:glycoside hydrolase family 20 protein [Streptomyces sp. NPDC050504]|uniref:glycoside hydrolase family 20 protein n=1 Tax=Streptomyces sp. NPDC050504 TaxID=3365618 RepID=UPI0037AC3208